MSIKLNDQLFLNLIDQAHKSPRLRSHYNLHKELDEPVQRLCIGLIKGTYIAPHHHPKDNKWELMLALKGSVCLVIYNESGDILEKNILKQGEALTGIELKPNTWHSVYPISDEAIIMEVKEGPFTPSQKSDFAKWAPSEGDKNVSSFLNFLSNAKVGEKF